MNMIWKNQTINQSSIMTELLTVMTKKLLNIMFTYTKWKYIQKLIFKIFFENSIIFCARIF